MTLGLILVWEGFLLIITTWLRAGLGIWWLIIVLVCAWNEGLVTTLLKKDTELFVLSCFGNCYLGVELNSSNLLIKLSCFWWVFYFESEVFYPILVVERIGTNLIFFFELGELFSGVFYSLIIDRKLGGSLKTGCIGIP